MTERQIAKAHHITINNQKPLQGWYLFITDTNEEFLVEKSSIFFTPQKVNFYQVDQSFKPNIIVPKKNNQSFNRISTGYLIGFLLYHILKRIFPLNLWFGETTLPPRMLNGTISIIITILFIAIWLIAGLSYRKYRFFRYCQKNHITIKQVGRSRIRLLPHINLPEQNKQKIKKNIYLYSGVFILFMVITFPFLLLSYFVKLRLFLMIGGYLHWTLFFRGPVFDRHSKLIEFKLEDKYTNHN